MAGRPKKTTKKEEVVNEVKTDVKKLTTEELEEVQKITMRYQEINQEFSRVGIDEVFLNERKANVSKMYLENRQAESELAEKLKEKYGEIVINPEDGTYTITAETENK